MFLSRVRILALVLWLMSAPPTATLAAYVSPAAAIASGLNPGLVSLADYTAQTDPEHLLGLPGQYVSKATFTDGSGMMGIVEVFATPTDFQNRLQLLGEYQTQTQEVDLPAPPSATSRVLLRLFAPAALDPTTQQQLVAGYADALTTALARGGYQ